MNGITHRQYAAAAIDLLRHHKHPAAALFTEPACVDAFVACSSIPDAAAELEVGGKLEWFGHTVASLLHFQNASGQGFRMNSDPSMGITGAAADMGTTIGHMLVTISEQAPAPPMANVATGSPVALAVVAQQLVPFSRFHFPSAGECASYHLESATNWLKEGNTLAAVRSLAYAVHFPCDLLIAQHTRLALWWGHQEHENDLERHWTVTHSGTFAVGSFPARMVQLIDEERAELATCQRVAQICHANVAWTQGHYPHPGELKECPGNHADRISLRAIASIVRACELATA